MEIVTKGVEQSRGAKLVPLPLPRTSVSVRPATLDDLAFIDALQKKHTKQVGWMPTKQFEGKIKLGHVLIAEEDLTADCADNADKKLDLSELRGSPPHREIGPPGDPFQIP